MTLDERESESASETDLAIERALEAANLRAGDSLGTSTASVSEEWEPPPLRLATSRWVSTETE